MQQPTDFPRVAVGNGCVRIRIGHSDAASDASGVGDVFANEWDLSTVAFIQRRFGVTGRVYIYYVCSWSQRHFVTLCCSRRRVVGNRRARGARTSVAGGFGGWCTNTNP